MMLCLITALLSVAVWPVVPPNVEGMQEILASFEYHAAEHSNSRSIINGFNASGQYVLQRMREFNDMFTVAQQHFTTPLWHELAPPFLQIENFADMALQPCPTDTGLQRYTTVCDYSGVRFGGNTSGPVEINTAAVKVHFPCTPDGFNSFQPGAVAIVSLGANASCPVNEIVTAAQRSGAVAVLLASTSGPPPNRRSTVYDAASWRPGVQLPSIPTLVITAGVEAMIYASVNRRVVIRSNQRIDVVSTYNIIATSRLGDLDNLLMIGAHLDSVPGGPGINDNGSGSALILQFALQLALRMRHLGYTGKAFRFAWWGAEEIGLVGSYFYVNQLVEHYPDELQKIWGYLNFDMEASGNYVPFIGLASTIPDPPGPTDGAFEIQNMFERAFDELSLKKYYSALNGGSDFFPFVLAGVPAGGLAAGAAGIKSEEQARDYGGLANAPHDPCYHGGCDTLANTNWVCLSRSGNVAASVVNQVLQAPLAGRNLTGVKPVTPELFHWRARQQSFGFAIGCDGDDGHTHAARARDEL